jgi:hypothetical protein
MRGCLSVSHGWYGVKWTPKFGPGAKYGDMMRAIRKTEKVGTSRHSLHYTGRAIDICQNMGTPRGDGTIPLRSHPEDRHGGASTAGQRCRMAPKGLRSRKRRFRLHLQGRSTSQRATTSTSPSSYNQQGSFSGSMPRRTGTRRTTSVSGGISNIWSTWSLRF